MNKKVSIYYRVQESKLFKRTSNYFSNLWMAFLGKVHFTPIPKDYYQKGSGYTSTGKGEQMPFSR